MIPQDTPTLVLIGTIAFILLVIVIGLLILWAIIRGAVLSALRKHHDETKGAIQPLYRGE